MVHTRGKRDEGKMENEKEERKVGSRKSLKQ